MRRALIYIADTWNHRIRMVDAGGHDPHHRRIGWRRATKATADLRWRRS